MPRGLRTVVMSAALWSGCGRIGFGARPDVAGSDARAAGTADSQTDDAAAIPLIYASTYPAADLYRIDPSTLEPTLDRSLCTNIVPAPSIGDITFDATGELIATGYPQTTIYRVDPGASTCTTIALSISSELAAAALIPAGVIGATAAVVVASQDGHLYTLDTTNGATQLIGAIGASPSGDLVWTGSELLLTVTTTSTDNLVSLDLTTGAIERTIGDTTFADVYGLAWLNNTLYGFTNAGQVVIMDPTTAAPIRVVVTTPAWGGGATTN
jgi:outer membrane protein assembly factor BamB